MARTATDEKDPSTTRWRIGGVIAVSVLVLIANVASGSAACGGENSGCALAGGSRPWRGRVEDGAGEPIAGTRVSYYFASAQPDGSPPDRPFTVVADEQGRYCVRWPGETAVAYVSVPAAERESVTLVSPDASGTPGASYLIASSGQPNLTVTNRGWNATTDAARRCATGSPAWYRVEDVKSNWRYRLLLYLPLLAVALSIAAWAALGRGRHRLGRWITSAGAAAAGAGLLLYVLVWVTHSI